MIEIIPAVLPKNLEELRHDLGRLRAAAPLVQVDLVGKNILAGEEDMPFWREFDFELDLMTYDPCADVQIAVALGASRIVVHLQDEKAREALEFLQKYRAGDFLIEAGAALASHDAPEALASFDGLYDYVQVMGIDHIGVQGEPPDPHGKDIELVRALRQEYPELSIQGDGAVAPRARELARAGASRLVVGSAIVRAADPKAALEALYTEANAQ